MDEEDLFRKQLAELLIKHNAIFCIEYWNESLELNFEISNRSVGNVLISTPEKIKHIYPEDIIK